MKTGLKGITRLIWAIHNNKLYVQLACLESFLLWLIFHTKELEELAPIQGQVARKKRKKGKNSFLSTKYLGRIVTYSLYRRAHNQIDCFGIEYQHLRIFNHQLCNLKIIIIYRYPHLFTVVYSFWNTSLWSKSVTFPSYLMLNCYNYLFQVKVKMK